MSSSSSSPQEERERQHAHARVADLVRFARTNHERNPTDSLAALLEALRLGAPSNAQGNAAAEAALAQVRAAVGDAVADHVTDVDARRRRAAAAVQALLDDRSTILSEQGREDLLRQTMEDGSSVVCGGCGGVVPSDRWRQHQLHWCDAIVDNENDTKDNIDT